jgi:hypothetical protein
VSSRSEYVHLRVEPSERKRWQEAAERSGRSLSAMVRDALEVELERCDHADNDEGLRSSVSPHQHSARAKAPATLAERLAAIGELVDGLGSGR